MKVLPDGDWPPSIGRHESKIALIQHGRDRLPGAKEVAQLQRDYVGGNVDRILTQKEEVGYEDIFTFENDVTGEKSKHFRMLIDGAPGVGKTVLCRRFCKDWGAGKILKQFSIVWLLHLRDEEIAKAKSIEDIFQLDDKELQAEIVNYLKKSEGYVNLLICDGFDELSLKERTEHSLFLDIIRGKVLPQCSVIVTSRPYASLNLQLESFTHHMEVVGFTEKQIEKCIKLNIPDSVKAEKLIDQLKQRLDILSLCYTPLNCAIILYVYRQSEYILPTTLTQLYTLYIVHTLKRSAKIHFENLDSVTIKDLNHLPDPIKQPYEALCEMAFDGLKEDQLGFDGHELPLSLKHYTIVKGTKPELLGMMSGSKSFSEIEEKLSYQFTHLTVQEYLAAWHAHIKLSAKEQRKLFQEKLDDDRFRMMLLFVAGITRLQDKQTQRKLKPPSRMLFHTSNTYLSQLLQKQHSDHLRFHSFLFFLAHLIYESQNASLCPILACLVRDDGELSLHFDDLFQCTVLTYFLSTCNYPWKVLELRGLTDQQMQVMQQVSREYAGRSDVRKNSLIPNDAHPLPFLEDTQEVRLQYWQSLPPSSPTCFSSLLCIKQLTTLEVVIRSPSGHSHSSDENKLIPNDDSNFNIETNNSPFISAWNKSLYNLFKALAQNTSLQKLVLLRPYILDGVIRFSVDKEVEEALSNMLKINTSLQCLVLCRLGLTNATATHIACRLAGKHSLKKLDIRWNNINTVGAVNIFRALEKNDTLETLEISGPLHSPSLPTGLGSSQLPQIQTTPLISTPEPLLTTFLPYSPSPTPQHEILGTALAGMLSHNNTLTILNVSHCHLTPQCCVSMFTALKRHNSPLNKLHMSCNSLHHEESSEALADMLSCNHSLTEIKLVGCDCKPNALARGLLHNTTLNTVIVSDDEKQPVVAALVEIRAQDGHTQQPDPEVSRCDKLLRYVCVNEWHIITMEVLRGRLPVCLINYSQNTGSYCHEKKHARTAYRPPFERAKTALSQQQRQETQRQLTR